MTGKITALSILGNNWGFEKERISFFSSYSSHQDLGAGKTINRWVKKKIRKY
jgi:hypothetical protein